MARQSSFPAGFIIYAILALLPSPSLAQKHVTDSLRAALEKVRSDTDKVTILYTISSMLPCNDSTNKLAYSTRAVALADKIKWKKGMLEANIRLGNFYEYCANKYQNAIVYYHNSAKIARSAGLRDDEAFALSCIGMAYFNYGHGQEALDYYHQSLRLNPGISMLLSIYPNMGNVYDKLGDYTRAISSYEQASNLLTHYLLTSKNSNINDSATLMGLLTTKADLYLKTMQVDKAISNYKQLAAFGAQQSTRNNDVSVFSIWAYSGLGKSFHVKQLDSISISYFENALAKSRRIKMPKLESAVLNEMSNLYLENGDINTAAGYARQSLEIAAGKTGRATGQKDSALLPQVYITLGKISIVKREYNTAISYLNEARNICIKTGDRNTEKDAWLALSACFDSTKKPGLAFHAYRNYTTIKDSLYSQEKTREMTRLDMQGEFDRKLMADSLKAEQLEKLAAVKFQRQQSILWGAVFFSLFVVVIIILIYANYKKVSALHKKVSIQKAELEKSNLEKGRILHIVAHDLRNPVGSIAYISEMMLMEGRNEKEIFESLKMINDSSQSSLSLINELSGFDDNNTEEEKQPEDINDIVATSVALLEFKAAEKQQTIVTHLSPGPAYAPVVREKISRVINNLLGNAIKFSNDHQVIETSVVMERNNVLITVKDYGLGIPENKKDALFEIFTSSKRFGTNGEKPFGLGLYISRQLVLAHGGTIDFESTENEGTTFYVRLPLKMD